MLKKAVVIVCLANTAPGDALAQSNIDECVAPNLSVQSGTIRVVDGTGIDALNDHLECMVRRTSALNSELERLRGTIQKMSGLVAAFPDGCPEGWREYESARGRMIVGVNPKELREDDGTVISKHEALAIGGAEKVALTAAQMPRHTHKLRTYGQLALDKTPHDLRQEIIAWSEKDYGDAHKNFEMDGTAPSGENLPHPNMPPYIALYFCKKD